MFNNILILIMKANNFNFNYRAENIKEAGWSRNYPSDLPLILGMIYWAINYHSVMKNIH